MLGIVENFIRRIEKLISSSPTVPQPGTNHVDDIWLNTDLYPGELAINLESGGLYTSDGIRIVNLNTEDALISGMVVSKDTSGVNKLTVSSGSVRIKGVEYFHTSSGTDILLPINATTDPELYFIYAQNTLGATASTLVVTSINSSYSNVYYDVASVENIPNPPADAVLLGTVLVPVGATGYSLQPLSIASLGDYYPKFSLTPSEYLRTLTSTNSLYKNSHLYFPGQIIIDYTSNTEYLSKITFISDYGSIANDISLGKVVLLGGAGGSGGSGTYTATSIGTGTADVYESTVVNQFRFRSITAGSNYLVVGYTGSSTISINIDPSKFVLGLTNSGSGSQIYKGITASSIAQLRSLTAGSSRLTLTTVGDNIVIDVPYIGTTAQGVNLGSTGTSVYGGMSGANLGFKRFIGQSGIGITQDTDYVYISTTAKNNNGINLSGGSPIYYGMSGDNLSFRSLTAGSNITITNIGNQIQISSSGGGGSVTGATSIGAPGGAIYAGPLGSDLSFRSITPGYGIAVTQVGNNVQIDATISNGAQGVQGFQGTQGFQGAQGVQGNQGAQGLSGTNGTNGLQGRQGPFGPQGIDGPIGPTGIPGLSTPIVPNNSIEIYDNGLGWNVSSGQQKLVTFDSIGAADSIYTVTQLSPVGNGTTLSSSVSGRYLIMYTITAVVTSGIAVEFVLYNVTNGTPVPGTTTRMYNVDLTTTELSVAADSIIDNSSGTEYGIMCTISPVTAGTITGVSLASSMTMIRLDGNKGEAGTQGPQGSGQVTQNNIVSTVTVGAIIQGDTIPTGSTLESFINQLVRKIYYPTYTIPTYALTTSASVLQEIGATISVPLAFAYNRGTINGSGIGAGWSASISQNPRGGTSSSYTLGASGGTTVTQSGNTYTVANYNILQGNSNNFNGIVVYGTGPQPIDSDGSNYQTGLSAGTSPTRTVTLEGVYPIFATVSSISTTTQLSLYSMLSGNNIQITLFAESGIYKQIFDLPLTWVTSRPLAGVFYYNLLSGSFDVVNKLSDFTVTSTTHTVQTASVNYNRYTYNGPQRASLLIKLTF